MTVEDKLKQIVNKYTKKGDEQKIHDTIDMLCSKGIGNGCYQDYTVLMDVVEWLTTLEYAVKEIAQYGD